MSKVLVDTSKCVGCGACLAICSNGFDLDDDGLSKSISDEVTEETREAVEACPFSAISIVEDETNEVTE